MGLFREEKEQWLKCLDLKNMEAPLYTKEGKEKGKVKLPKEVFECSWNPDLVHQVVVSLESNKRRGTADAKDRSAVRGGGKKPWRQKGTGRARHGSSRSPIWVGGGVTHGPSASKKYNKKVNEKMKTKSFWSLISRKYKDGEVFFVDGLDFDAPKTAEAKKALESLSKVEGLDDLSTKKHNSAMLVFDGKKENVWKSFKNMGNVSVNDIKNVSTLDLVRSKYLILFDPEKSLDFIKSKKS